MSKRLSVYLMSFPETPELAEAAVGGGADLLELGFPLDPLADGPVIRAAGERALGARDANAAVSGVPCRDATSRRQSRFRSSR